MRRAEMFAVLATVLLAVTLLASALMYLLWSPTVYEPVIAPLFPSSARISTQFPAGLHARAPRVDVPDDITDVLQPEKNFGPSLFFGRTLGTVSVDVLRAADTAAPLRLRDVEELRFTAQNSLGNRASNDLSDVFAAPPSGVWTLRIKLANGVELAGLDRRAMSDTGAANANGSTDERRLTTSTADLAPLPSARSGTLLWARSDGDRSPSLLFREAVRGCEGEEVTAVRAQLARSALDSVTASGEGKRGDDGIAPEDGIRLDSSHGDDNDLPACLREVVVRAARGGPRGSGLLHSLLPTATLPASALAVSVSDATIWDTAENAQASITLAEPSADIRALLAACKDNNATDEEWRLVTQLYSVRDDGRVDVAGNTEDIDLEDIDDEWPEAFTVSTNLGDLTDTLDVGEGFSVLSNIHLRVSLWGKLGMGGSDGGDNSEEFTPFYTSPDMPVTFTAVAPPAI